MLAAMWPDSNSGPVTPPVVNSTEEPDTSVPEPPLPTEGAGGSGSGSLPPGGSTGGDDCSGGSDNGSGSGNPGDNSTDVNGTTGN